MRQLRGLDRDAALVVVDERLAGGVVVDAVDAPAQPHAAGQLERGMDVVGPAERHLELGRHELRVVARRRARGSAARRSAGGAPSRAGGWDRATSSSPRCPRSARARAAASARACGSVVASSRPEPVFSIRPRMIASSTVWVSAPRSIASGSGVSPSGCEQPLDEPLHRAARPQLDARRRPGRAVAQLGDERLVAQRARSAPRAVAARDRRAAQPLALARRARPSGQPTCAERARALALLELGAEQVADVGDEERAHAQVAVVAGLVPGQVEALLGPRDRRVEEVALGAEVVAAAQAQARRRGDLLTLDVAEERLGARRGGKDALLQAAGEEDPHAARAQRQRLGDRHEAGPGRVPTKTSRSCSSAASSSASRRQRAVGAGERRELLERLARPPSGPRRPAARDREHLRGAPPRRREQRLQLRREALGAARRRRARCAARTRSIASSAQRSCSQIARAASALRAPSWRARASSRSANSGRCSRPGRAQVGEQVLGGAVGQRAAQQADEAAPERRVAERDAAIERDRHAEGAEDLRQQRGVLGGRAQHDGDLLRRDAAPRG